MKIQLNEVDRRLIERINEKIQVSTYIDDDDYIEVNDLLALLDDLDDAYNDLSFQYEEYKLNVEENYKPIGEGDNYHYYASTIKRLTKECDRQHEFIKEKGLLGEYGRN